jgi:Tfp pilus assembly major pilin PilA
VKCHACGHDNADSALFCTACRRPLVAPTKLPTRLEPLAATAAPSAAAMPPLAPPSPSPAPGDAGGRNRFAPPHADAGNGSRAGDPSQALTDEEALAAVVGDSNTVYYLGAFDRIARGAGGGWNWPAFLITWYWMLYRKMWVPALIYFFAPWAVVIVFSIIMVAMGPLAAMLGPLLFLGGWLAQLIVPAIMANGWYYRHCQAKVRDVRARGGSKEQVLARLEAAGGTSNVAIIIAAVLFVMVVPGILAAVSIPAYQQYTFKAKVLDAIQEGTAVAEVAGRQFEATGQYPTDIDRIAQQSPHQSKYVRGIELDGMSGTLTVHIEVTPTVAGSIQLSPNVDASRHVTWSCSTTDLLKYVPKSCRG